MPSSRSAALPRRNATAKKSPAKKSPAKKSPVKRSTAKKSTARTGAGYSIDPLRGVGPARFGMRAEEVAAVLGPPKKTKDDQITKYFHEWRGRVEFIYDKRKLVDVVFPRGTSVYYGDLEMYGAKNLVDILRGDSSDWEDAGQYINFSDLGICLGGFGKRRIPEGKLIMVYGRSRVKVFKQLIHV
jgi:hypothetical protein